MKRRPRQEQQIPQSDRAIDDELIEEESEVGEEIRATLTAMMPWGISILAHVGLIVFAFFLVWQTIVKEERQPTVPIFTSSPEVTISADPVDELTDDSPSSS